MAANQGHIRLGKGHTQRQEGLRVPLLRLLNLLLRGQEPQELLPCLPEVI
jgi:hypothetical protein